MPFTASGTAIVGKSPIHTQLLISDPVTHGTIYVPVKGFTWSKETGQTPNLHSGSPLPSDLVDEHHKYSVTFETGTWLVEEVNKEVASKWEWLAFKYLVRPYDQGRSRPFTAIYKQASYYDDGDIQVEAGSIIWFDGCKLRKMAHTHGENGIHKRSYEADAMRLTYGDGEQESERSK